VTAETPRPFPWGQVMHLGLAVLRLSPRAFWALSPREFFAMTGQGQRTPQVDLAALMARFPDASVGAATPQTG
jgi:uncharacterized phage protein (TIGR02216 family)